MLKGHSANRQALTIIYVLLFACIISCIYYVSSVRTAIQQSFTQEIDTLLTQRTDMIQNRIEVDQRRLVEGAAQIGKNNYLNDQKALQGYLSTYSNQHDYKELTVSKADGTTIAADGVRQNIKSQDYFNEAMSGKYSISEPFQDPLTHERFIIYSVPLVLDGKIVGTVNMTKSVRIIEEELLNNFYVQDGTCYIMDAAGNVILNSPSRSSDHESFNLYSRMTSDEATANENLVLVDKIKADLATGKSGIVLSTVNGVPSYIGYHKVGGEINNWILLTFVDTNTVLSKGQQSLMKTMVLCGLIVTCLMGMALYILYIRDKAQRGIEKLAYIDSLTGIDNINRFRVRAAQLLGKHAVDQYAIISLDIQNFKYINETYGYPSGDKILISLAHVIKHKMNDREACARISGDKFILLYELDDKNFTRYHAMIATYMQDHLYESIHMNISLNITAGAYLIPPKKPIYQVNIDEPMINMYETEKRPLKSAIMSMIDKANLAQKAGRDNAVESLHCYDDVLMQTFVHQNEMEAMMKGALKNGEFKAYLQPKFNLKTLEIVGAEALVRWISPVKGFMRPDEFVPILEKNGFIIEIDFYVLEEVCKKIREWLDAGVSPVPISVNQSRVHINQPFYMERLAGVLKKYNIPAKFIEMELTESMFFDNTSRLIQMMKEMHGLGLSISMDDFGSGYSSLNLLKELPVDTLKIDKVFLDETTNSERSQIIIAQVVEMARKLGMEIVCEGVETKEQAEFLREISCDIAQGFLYAKPMAMEEFDSFRKQSS